MFVAAEPPDFLPPAGFRQFAASSLSAPRSPSGTRARSRDDTGRPPSCGPVRSIRKELIRSSRREQRSRSDRVNREERCSFRIERTGPPDGGRPCLFLSRFTSRPKADRLSVASGFLCLRDYTAGVSQIALNTINPASFQPCAVCSSFTTRIDFPPGGPPGRLFPLRASRTSCPAAPPRCFAPSIRPVPRYDRCRPSIQARSLLASGHIPAWPPAIAWSGGCNRSRHPCRFAPYAPCHALWSLPPSGIASRCRWRFAPAGASRRALRAFEGPADLGRPA